MQAMLHTRRRVAVVQSGRVLSSNITLDWGDDIVALYVARTALIIFRTAYRLHFQSPFYRQDSVFGKSAN